jgi:hypothetical protein
VRQGLRLGNEPFVQRLQRGRDGHDFHPFLVILLRGEAEAPHVNGGNAERRMREKLGQQAIGEVVPLFEKRD